MWMPEPFETDHIYIKESIEEKYRQIKEMVN